MSKEIWIEEYEKALNALEDSEPGWSDKMREDAACSAADMQTRERLADMIDFARMQRKEIISAERRR